MNLPKKDNLVIIFPQKADLALEGILRKNNLQETDDQVSKDYREKRMPNVVIVDHLIKDLLKGKISNEVFFNTLEEKLRLPRTTIKNISLDIMHNLVPLLDIVKEEELIKYNAKKESLRALMESTNKKPVFPFDKKVEFKNVEENAEKLRQTKEQLRETQNVEENAEKLTKARTVIQPETETRGPDSYREPIDDN